MCSRLAGNSRPSLSRTASSSVDRSVVSARASSSSTSLTVIPLAAVARQQKARLAILPSRSLVDSNQPVVPDPGPAILRPATRNADCCRCFADPAFLAGKRN